MIDTWRNSGTGTVKPSSSDSITGSATRPDSAQVGQCQWGFESSSDGYSTHMFYKIIGFYEWGKGAPHLNAVMRACE